VFATVIQSTVMYALLAFTKHSFVQLYTICRVSNESYIL